MLTGMMTFAGSALITGMVAVIGGFLKLTEFSHFAAKIDIFFQMPDLACCFY